MDSQRPSFAAPPEYQILSAHRVKGLQSGPGNTHLSEESSGPSLLSEKSSGPSLSIYDQWLSRPIGTRWEDLEGSEFSQPPSVSPIGSGVQRALQCIQERPAIPGPKGWRTLAWGRAMVATCGGLGLWLRVESRVALRLKFWYQLAFSGPFRSCVDPPPCNR